MADLFTPDIPPNYWAADPASINACVFDAVRDAGLFSGAEVWQHDLWERARILRRCRTEYRHNPTHETLARALRGRGAGAGRIEVRDYLASQGWRVVEAKGKVRLERITEA